MQLISMRLTEDEAREESGATVSSPSAEDLPKYPYGLCLDLCDEALQKLGIAEMPPIGSVMQVMATVEVSRVSQYENQEGKDASLSLQITDMALSAPATPQQPARASSDIAKSLYG